MVKQNNSTNVCRNQSSKMNLRFDFTSMIEEYIKQHNPPRLLKDLMLHQLKLCKNRQERDERKGKKQQYTCDGCLQLFNQEDLMKHK